MSAFYGLFNFIDLLILSLNYHHYVSQNIDSTVLLYTELFAGTPKLNMVWLSIKLPPVKLNIKPMDILAKTWCDAIYHVHDTGKPQVNNGLPVLDFHYSVVIMGAMASQITSPNIVYSIVYPGADQRKRHSSTLLAFVRGIHRWPVNFPHKRQVTRKMFPFDDVIMRRNHTTPFYVESSSFCYYYQRMMIIRHESSKCRPVYHNSVIVQYCHFTTTNVNRDEL